MRSSRARICQQAPRLRAVEHNRGARESESCGDGGRSGSFAMRITVTALGPRVRPAAVAVGPRGSTSGGTVGAIATAANRQKCLRRRAPGATIARLDAHHALGVGAGSLRRGRRDTAARGARAYRLQVNAHGDHGHGTSLSPLPRPTRYAAHPTRHRCLISITPAAWGASTWAFSLTNQHFFVFLALGRDLRKGFLRRGKDHLYDRVRSIDPSPRSDPERRADDRVPPLTSAPFLDVLPTDTGHSHSSGRPNFSDDAAAADDDACAKACCGGSVFGSEDAPADRSFDENAFVSEAGIGSGDGFGDSGGASPKPAGANLVETALTAFYRATGLGKISDFLRGNAAACGVAWCFLLIAGVAHGLTHVGALAESFAATAASARAVETAATALVYLVAGPSEFVDVSYELAVGNVNIHVLTTLAVAGTVFVGCALEGSLLLVLFSSAAFVEMRLTGHARGDLKSLWATVPGEAVLVDVDATSAPVAATEQVIPARDVPVGANVFVRSGQQVRPSRRRFSAANPPEPELPNPAVVRRR